MNGGVSWQMLPHQSLSHRSESAITAGDRTMRLSRWSSMGTMSAPTAARSCPSSGSSASALDSACATSFVTFLSLHRTPRRSLPPRQPRPLPPRASSGRCMSYCTNTRARWAGHIWSAMRLSLAWMSSGSSASLTNIPTPIVSERIFSVVCRVGPTARPPST